ncbi:MAG: hypothetical protein JXR95_13555 [Deltaproteobacteria bacterium]|nr:hypothetical protein [Deltaproteobacteria bacterium]
MKTINFIIFFVLIFSVISCDDSSNSTNNTSTLNNLNNSAICGNVGGESYTYVISEIYIPSNPAENVGADLDGDGFVDNKLANLMQSLLSTSSDFSINPVLAETIEKGDTAILANLKIEDFTGDNSISATLIEGSFTGTDLGTMFSGNGVFSVDTQSPTSATLCGRVYGNGYLDMGPASVDFSLPVSDTQTVNITLHNAVLQGTASEEEWTDIIIAGAVEVAAIRDSVLPAFVENVNDDILDDPEGSQFILDTFDNQCSSEYSGCDDLSECVDDGVITLTELKCNGTVNIVLTPDITIDGVDYVSLGLKVQAVKAVIDNL